MFYFDSNMTRPNAPLQCAALDFKKAYIDRMSFGYAERKSNKHGPIEHGLKNAVTAICYRINKTLLTGSKRD